MTFDMYREIIMDHFKNPRNFGELAKPDGTAQRDNPLCGDQVKITYTFDTGKKRLADIKFSGTGCSLTRAGASMLTEFVKGKTIKELQQYSEKDFLKDLTVPVMPARRKCVLLGWNTLHKALEETPAADTPNKR